MNSKQLRDLRASARTNFLAFEGRLFDIRSRSDEGVSDAETKEYLEVLIRFSETHFLFEETKSHCYDYEAIQLALNKYGRGESFDPYPDDDGLTRTIWEYCLSKLTTDQVRYSLINHSSLFELLADTEYERSQATRQMFDKFFGDVPKGVVVDGQFETLTPEEEGEINLQQDVSNIELSFVAIAFRERMGRAKLLCELRADPTTVLELFP